MFSKGMPELPSPASVSRNVRIVSVCTLFSRILGLLRDQGLAAYFGNGSLLDAFTVAFRLPNLARMLLGEGALATAFLPAFVAARAHEGDQTARQLASAVFLATAAFLCGGVVLAEFILWQLGVWFSLSSEALLLRNLTAAMLPYVILICLAAQQCAVLNALGRFMWPALVPVVLNAVWLLAMVTYVRLWSEPEQQMYAMCLTVVAAGACQLALPMIALHWLGFGWSRPASNVWPNVRLMMWQMLPVVAGLSVIQFNVLLDSLIAWGFAQPESGAEHMAWFPGVRYPLSSGTASALYFGQRLYQFPLGVFGVALGTVLFPLLATHAQHQAWDELRRDLALGIRLVLAIGIPASAGLMLLAQPLAESFFQYGRFDAEDVRQTSGMIACYGFGVWAYCGLLILQRGFYAVGDRITPLRIGLAAMFLDLTSNLTLIWPLGGIGLALTTSLVAVVQCLVSGWLMQARVGRLDWREISRTLWKTLFATAVMSAACWGTSLLLPTTSGRLIRLVAPLIAGACGYFLAAKLIGLDEPWLLLRRERAATEDDLQVITPSE